MNHPFVTTIDDVQQRCIFCGGPRVAAVHGSNLMGRTANKEMTTVYIEEYQDMRLKQLKAATGVPVAEYIRQGVDRILEQNKHLIEDQKPAVDFIRASGDCVCDECGDTYYHHPRDMKNLGYDDQPFLHVLCGGQRVKL